MPTVGIVLCRCNSIISGRLDFGYLAEELAGEKELHLVTQVDMACSPQGKKAIEEIAASEEIDRFVIAGCSPVAKGAVIKGYAGGLNMAEQHIEIVNIREQCAWVHDAREATGKALVLIRMGLKRVIAAKNVGNWGLNCAHVQRIKCDKCKRCIEECPNNAIRLAADEYPEVSVDVCQRCGICVGGCPLGAISLPDMRLEDISAMLAPVAGSGYPSIVGFFCDFAYAEADLMGQTGQGYSPYIYIIRVPCTGAVNMIVVNDAIAEGIDEVLVAGCDSSQCKLRKGNQLARYRIENTQKSLEEQFLEKERVCYVSLGEGAAEPCEIDLQKCTGCGLCIQVCPFGAIRLTEEGGYQVNAKGCRACGVCVASCRSGAVNSPYCSNEKIMAAIDCILAG